MITPPPGVCKLKYGQPVGRSQDLPDHFSNELRLMSHLWSGEAAASRAGRGRLAGLSTKLRDEHLLKWLGQLRGKVSKQDRLGFYSAAFRVVEVVLENVRN